MSDLLCEIVPFLLGIFLLFALPALIEALVMRWDERKGPRPYYSVNQAWDQRLHNNSVQNFHRLNAWRKKYYKWINMEY